MNNVQWKNNFFGLTKNGANQLFTSFNRTNSSNNVWSNVDLYKGFSEVNSIGYKHLLKAYFDTKAGRDDSTHSRQGILNQLNNTIDLTKITAADTKELKSNADQLQKTIQDLTQQDEMGQSILFQKERDDIDRSITDFIKSYNNFLEKTSNNNYSNNRMTSLNTQLKVLTSINSVSLGKIGLTVHKDGTLTIDEEIYKNTDTKALEEGLGNTSSFTKNLYIKAEYVSSNAARYTNNTTGTYNIKAVQNYNMGNLFNSFF